MNFKSFKHCHRPSLAFWSKEAVTHECPWDSVLLTSNGGTTVGSVEVLSLVAINSCQVSLLGGFHPNSSLETTEGLLASQQASRSLTTADSPGDGGRDAGGWRHHFTGFTPTHMPQWIRQLRLHLTLDMQPTKQTSMEGWERPRARAGGGEGGWERGSGC